MGAVWSEGGTLDLKALLDPVCNPHLDNLSFLMNGKKNADGVLEYGKEPKDLVPAIFHIELRYTDIARTFDRLWIILNSIKTRDDFDDWYSRFSTNLAWVATLPKPYSQITLNTNKAGVVAAIDPEPGYPNHWSKPKPPVSRFLHHNAQYEMRSIAVTGGHGNQACYDANGQLIRSGIVGGTADWGFASFWNAPVHAPEDVLPFIKAVWLDGNPGLKTTFNNLTRPCLYEGLTIALYIYCRPITLP